MWLLAISLVVLMVIAVSCARWNIKAHHSTSIQIQRGGPPDPPADAGDPDHGKELKK